MDELSYAIQHNPEEFLGLSATLKSVRNEPSWHSDFERHETLDTDQTTFIIGEILGEEEGTRLGAAGNRNMERIPLLEPMQDGESVQDVFVLGKPTDSSYDSEKIWQRQMTVLGWIEGVERSHSEVNNQRPVSTRSWRLGESGQLLEVLWEKYCTADPDVDVVQFERITGEAALYDPSVLPDFSAAFLDLKTDALVQQPIFDENWELIPPWELCNKLPPGSLLVLLVSLHCKNIYLNCEGAEDDFNRRYEIRGRSAKVLKRGDAENGTVSAAVA